MKKNWKDIYVNMMFPVNKFALEFQHPHWRDFAPIILPSDNDTEKAEKYKYYNLPKILYKYRSFNDNNKASLYSNELWLSNPVDFNDPFDSIYNLKILNPRNWTRKILKLVRNDNEMEKSVKDEIIKMLKHTFEVISKDFNKQLTEISEIKPKILQYTTFVGCLSEIYDSLLMWTHYADNHKGFCIGYSISELKYEDELSGHLFPVIYKEDNGYDCAGQSSPYRFFQLFTILRKSINWEYEKEWRFVFSNEKNKVKMPKIKEIFMGIRIENENKQFLIDFTKRNKNDLYQGYLNNGNTEITFKKYKYN